MAETQAEALAKNTQVEDSPPSPSQNEPVIVSSGRVHDIEPYAWAIYEADRVKWSAILPRDWPLSGKKEDEEAFLRGYFTTREIRMQGGDEHNSGEGYRFLKHVWNTIAIYNTQVLVPTIVDQWWSQEKYQEILRDQGLRSCLMDDECSETDAFDDQFFAVYSPRILYWAMRHLQDTIRHNFPDDPRSKTTGKNIVNPPHALNTPYPGARTFREALVRATPCHNPVPNKRSEKDDTTEAEAQQQPIPPESLPQPESDMNPTPTPPQTEQMNTEANSKHQDSPTDEPGQEKGEAESDNQDGPASQAEQENTEAPPKHKDVPTSQSEQANTETPSKHQDVPTSQSEEAKEETPVKKDTTPLKKDTTPLKKDTTPLKKDTTPLKKDTTPLKKDTTPLEKDTTPSQPEQKNTEAPSKHQDVPVSQTEEARTEAPSMDQDAPSSQVEQVNIATPSKHQHAAKTSPPALVQDATLPPSGDTGAQSSRGAFFGSHGRGNYRHHESSRRRGSMGPERSRPFRGWDGGYQTYMAAAPNVGNQVAPYFPGPMPYAGNTAPQYYHRPGMGYPVHESHVGYPLQVGIITQGPPLPPATAQYGVWPHESTLWPSQQVTYQMQPQMQPQMQQQMQPQMQPQIPQYIMDQPYAAFNNQQILADRTNEQYWSPHNHESGYQGNTTFQNESYDTYGRQNNPNSRGGSLRGTGGRGKRFNRSGRASSSFTANEAANPFHERSHATPPFIHEANPTGRAHQDGAVAYGGTRGTPVISNENTEPMRRNTLDRGMLPFDSPAPYTGPIASADQASSRFDPDKLDSGYLEKLKWHLEGGHPLPVEMACSYKYIGDHCLHATKLVIFDLPVSITEKMLEDLFEPVAGKSSVSIVRKAGCNPYSFVLFRNHHLSRAALNLPNPTIEGRLLSPQVAKEHWDRQHSDYPGKNVISAWLEKKQMVPASRNWIQGGHTQGQGTTVFSATHPHTKDKLNNPGAATFEARKENETGNTATTDTVSNTPKPASKPKRKQNRQKTKSSRPDSTSNAAKGSTNPSPHALKHDNQQSAVPDADKVQPRATQGTAAVEDQTRSESVAGEPELTTDNTEDKNRKAEPVSVTADEAEGVATKDGWIADTAAVTSKEQSAISDAPEADDSCDRRPYVGELEVSGSIDDSAIATSNSTRRDQVLDIAQTEGRPSEQMPKESIDFCSGMVISGEVQIVGATASSDSSPRTVIRGGESQVSQMMSPPGMPSKDIPVTGTSNETSILNEREVLPAQPSQAVPGEAADSAKLQVEPSDLPSMSAAGSTALEASHSVTAHALPTMPEPAQAQGDQDVAIVSRKEDEQGIQRKQPKIKGPEQTVSLNPFGNMKAKKSKSKKKDKGSLRGNAKVTRAPAIEPSEETSLSTFESTKKETDAIPTPKEENLASAESKAPAAQVHTEQQRLKEQESQTHSPSRRQTIIDKGITAFTNLFGSGKAKSSAATSPTQASFDETQQLLGAYAKFGNTTGPSQVTKPDEDRGLGIVGLEEQGAHGDSGSAKKKRKKQNKKKKKKQAVGAAAEMPPKSSPQGSPVLQPISIASSTSSSTEDERMQGPQPTQGEGQKDKREGKQPIAGTGSSRQPELFFVEHGRYKMLQPSSPDPRITDVHTNVQTYSSDQADRDHDVSLSRQKIRDMENEEARLKRVKELSGRGITEEAGSPLTIDEGQSSIGEEGGEGSSSRMSPASVAPIGHSPWSDETDPPSRIDARTQATQMELANAPFGFGWVGLAPYGMEPGPSVTFANLGDAQIYIRAFKTFPTGEFNFFMGGRTQVIQQTDGFVVSFQPNVQVFGFRYLLAPPLRVTTAPLTPIAPGVSVFDAASSHMAPLGSVHLCDTLFSDEASAREARNKFVLSDEFREIGGGSCMILGPFGAGEAIWQVKFLLRGGGDERLLLAVN